jgi:hypothetical protein
MFGTDVFAVTRRPLTRDQPLYRFGFPKHQLLDRMFQAGVCARRSNGRASLKHIASQSVMSYYSPRSGFVLASNFMAQLNRVVRSTHSEPRRAKHAF